MKLSSTRLSPLADFDGVEKPRTWQSYVLGLGLALVLAAVLSVQGTSGGVVVVLLLPSVMAASYIGGWVPGLVTTAFCTLIALVLSPPAFHLTVASSKDLERVVGVALVGTLISVTIEALHRARRRAQDLYAASRQSEARLTAMFFASPVAKSLSRLQDGEVVEVNDAYLRTFGVTREEIIGHTPASAGISVDARARERLFSELRERGELRELEITSVSHDGTERIVLLSSRLAEVDGESLVLSTFIDVTARRNAERKARDFEQRFRELADTIEEVFWVTDVSKQMLLYLSPGYERVWGRTAQGTYDNPMTWLEAVHPEDRARIQRALAKQPLGTYDERYRIVRPDGEVRWIHDKGLPVRDESGTVVRIAGVAQDITEQLALQESLHQAQKLDSIGLLAGGIAHDFNNLLSVVTGNVDMLLDSIAPGTPERQAVEEIDNAAQRGTQLTRQLLAFGRKQVLRPVIVEINQVVDDARRMLRRMIREDIKLEFIVDPRAGHVRVDPGQLGQVLMNLCVNARDAIEANGTISIETHAAPTEALLVVRDDGPGMTAEVKARVFEPFFTTKAVGKGTGLGLAVVYGVIDQAGGKVEVESEQGRGTVFTIRLPTVAAEVTEVAPTVVAAPAAGSSEMILLVDDDAPLRATAARLLKHRGYRVVEARDGDEALRKLRASSEPIALLITDVVMPGMSGRELAEAASREFPTMRVLYTSGYTDDVVMRRGIQSDQVAFIEKPFGAALLASKVRQVLDECASSH